MRKQNTLMEIFADREAKQAAGVQSHILSVPIDNLRAWAGNPRQSFDEEGLRELADEMKAHGFTSVLLVRPTTCPQEIEEGACYQVIAGARRLIAARMAGLSYLPCMVRECDDKTALLLAIAENIHRQEMDPVETAKAYARVIEAGVSQGEIARTINKTQPWVSGYLRLLELPDDVQRLVSQGELSLAHAKALMRFKAWPGAVSAMAALVIEKRMSSHELERLDMPFGYELSKQGVLKALYRYGAGSKPHPECANCPLDAYRPLNTYDAVCLRPDHWEELAHARVEAAKQEAARSLAERLAAARPTSIAAGIQEAASLRGLPSAPTAERVAEEFDRISDDVDEPVDAPDEEEAEEIAPETPRLVTFDDLAGGYEQIFDLEKRPPGCDDGCRCFLKVFDKATGTVKPICLDGERYRRLQLEESKATSKDRKQFFGQLRQRIVATPLQDRYIETVAMLTLPTIAGGVRDARAHYVKLLKLEGLWGGIPASFRAVLEKDGYLAPYDSDLRASVADMTPDGLILHARNLELFSELHKAQQYKGGTPTSVCRVLGITPDGTPMGTLQEAQAQERVETLLDEEEAIDDEEEELEGVTCERCVRLIPKHALGSPPEEEQRFQEGNPARERVLTRLESGVLAVNLLSTGDVLYYCAECGPGVVWCRVCGCTQEIGCNISFACGCSWVEDDLCSLCAESGVAA